MRRCGSVLLLVGMLSCKADLFGETDACTGEKPSCVMPEQSGCCTAAAPSVIASCGPEAPLKGVERRWMCPGKSLPPSVCSACPAAQAASAEAPRELRIPPVLAPDFEAKTAAPAKPWPSEGAAVPADALIRLERTECADKCPVYTVSIRPDGSVVFDGRANVKVPKATGRVPKTAVRKLLDLARTTGFGAYQDSYSSVVENLPSAIVTVTAEGRTKVVRHRPPGDKLTAPAGLTQIEEAIDKAAGTARWIR